MNAILKPLAVPNLHRHATPAQTTARRKKGEKEAAVPTKPTWPFKEMTVNQKRTDMDVNRTKYCDYSKYETAKTLVIKCAGDDDLRPYAFVNGEKRIRKYQHSKPDAHPVLVLFWFSDIQRTRLIDGEFRMEPYDPCSLLRDERLDSWVYGTERVFFSEEAPEELAAELEAMPLEERWVPDEATLRNRRDREKAEKEDARDRDFYPRYAREMQELCDALWPSKFTKNTNDRLAAVRSFDADIRKILKRFDTHALATFDSLVDDFGVNMVDLHWRLYNKLFEGMAGCGYDSDRRLRGWGWCKRSVDSFIELFELAHKKHRNTTQTT